MDINQAGTAGSYQRYHPPITPYISNIQEFAINYTCNGDFLRIRFLILSGGILPHLIYPQFPALAIGIERL
jgi:hypothetical protein